MYLQKLDQNVTTLVYNCNSTTNIQYLFAPVKVVISVEVINFVETKIVHFIVRSN